MSGVLLSSGEEDCNLLQRFPSTVNHRDSMSANALLPPLWSLAMKSEASSLRALVLIGVAAAFCAASVPLVH